MLLAARDRGLYTAITDCGAGGFSQRRRRDGREDRRRGAPRPRPAEVRRPVVHRDLDLRSPGADGRSACPRRTGRSCTRCARAKASRRPSIGTFEPTGRLVLKYHGETVGDLPMQFLHDGRPPVVRRGDVHAAAPPRHSQRPLAASGEEPRLTRTIAPRASSARSTSPARNGSSASTTTRCKAAASIKPLVGVANDGPGDAAVVRPVLDSRRGVVISCGMNPRYGDFDPYHMAASAIDEAVRNCVAVGADPARIAILDNFCWGNCDRPETLGSLVRAALACHDLSLALETPFISGKDSLNNEFSYFDRPRTARSRTHRHPAVAAHQRPGPGRRRAPLRHDGPEAARQPALPRRRDEGRTRRLALRAW